MCVAEHQPGSYHRRGICDDYRFWPDQYANEHERWLREHRGQLIDAPSDDNLGPCIVPVAKYNSLAAVVLQKSFVEVPQDAIVGKIDSAKLEILNLVKLGELHIILAPKLVAYMQCLFETYKMPNLRLLIKVHKGPVECRSISSGTSWIRNPIASYTAQCLQPIVADSRTIAKDTGEVIDSLQKLNGGEQAFTTFDVNQLYPSIPLDTCVAAIGRVLEEWFIKNPSRLWRLRIELLQGNGD